MHFRNPLNTTATNCATYGNVSTINWEPYNNKTRKYLDMNDTFEMSVFHEMDRMRYWDAVYKAYGDQEKESKKVKEKEIEEKGKKKKKKKKKNKKKKNKKKKKRRINY